MRNSESLRVITIFLAALSVNGLAMGADSGAIGEPGRESGKPNPLKNVYFGEQHMHTRNSFDAFTIGVSANLGRRLPICQGRRGQALHNRQADEAQDAL